MEMGLQNPPSLESYGIKFGKHHHIQLVKIFLVIYILSQFDSQIEIYTCSKFGQSHCTKLASHRHMDSMHNQDHRSHQNCPCNACASTLYIQFQDDKNQRNIANQDLCLGQRKLSVETYWREPM